GYGWYRTAPAKLEKHYRRWRRSYGVVRSSQRRFHACEQLPTDGDAGDGDASRQGARSGDLAGGMPGSGWTSTPPGAWIPAIAFSFQDISLTTTGDGG
ncbi:hypothetical protein, partial [Microbulbifer sp.]|uniref:hypothetical protein n=1 Tax=Microbulbifer sp. TaxID=1908541 RepID=UPI003F35FB07